MKLLILGCGSRICGILDELLKWDDTLEVSGIVDPDNEGALRRLSVVYRKPAPPFFGSPGEAIEATGPDGVLIGTRCDLHTELALQAMAYNIPMFLEKPVSVTKEQTLMLNEASKSYRSQAVCSFPLRVSPIVQAVKEIMASGKLGTVEHVQAVNNVPYGTVYYHDWYRDESITHGLWLQKATHDFDYIIDILGAPPVTVCAMGSKQIFKGDKPAGLKCADCDENKTCPESPYILINEKYESVTGEYCCFAKDTGNQDSGSAILRFPSGMHAVYSQNFFARKAAATRGARLLGYKGTLEFDWYTNEIKVMSHFLPKVEKHIFDSSAMSHFGGDQILARNFLDVCRGKPSLSPLSAGIISAWTCLHADESDRTGMFREISLITS